MAQRGVWATLGAGGSGLRRHFHVGLAGELRLFYSRAIHAPLQKQEAASFPDRLVALAVCPHRIARGAYAVGRILWLQIIARKCRQLALPCHDSHTLGPFHNLASKTKRNLGAAFLGGGAAQNERFRRSSYTKTKGVAPGGTAPFEASIPVRHRWCAAGRLSRRELNHRSTMLANQIGRTERERLR